MSDNLKKPTVMALGYFDSVHIGHRDLIRKAKKYAIEHGATLTVFTFSVNLRAMLNGTKDKIVYLPSEREVLINELGADEVFFAPANFKFLSMGKLAFLNMINRKFNIICYFSGEDYKFGKFGKGCAEDIRRYAEEKKQEYVIVDTLKHNDKKVSTSGIKRLLSQGDVEKANVMLGKSYSLTGTVFQDRKVGEKLGFPTLNINIDKDKYRLRDGVYAGHIFIDDKKYIAIINYGPRPTFDLEDKLIEAHIIDFCGNLYGRELTVYFDAYMRETQKFADAKALSNQIARDLEWVKGKKYD